MSLVKVDYENILKILERVEIKGRAEAHYIVELAHRLEATVAAWAKEAETAVESVFETKNPA